jgi:hypothetical protein
MKFNSKYNVYVSKDGLIYYVKNDKLVLRNHNLQDGYVKCQTKLGQKYVHRIVYETFCGEIPEGFEIDHINAVRDDNRLCNLQLMTHIENARKAHCGKSSWMKGRHLSDSTKAKISYATKR